MIYRFIIYLLLLFPIYFTFLFFFKYMVTFCAIDFSKEDCNYIIIYIGDYDALQNPINLSQASNSTSNHLQRKEPVAKVCFTICPCMMILDRSENLGEMNKFLESLTISNIIPRTHIYILYTLFTFEAIALINVYLLVHFDLLKWTLYLIYRSRPLSFC